MSIVVMGEMSIVVMGTVMSDMYVVCHVTEPAPAPVPAMVPAPGPGTGVAGRCWAVCVWVSDSPCSSVAL